MMGTKNQQTKAASPVRSELKNGGLARPAKPSGPPQLSLPKPPPTPKG